MRKKGSARDVIFAAVIFFVIGIALFLSYFVQSKVKEGMLAVDEINQSNATVEALNDMDAVQAKFDYLMLAVFVGIAIGMVVVGWLIGGFPLFMVVYFFGIVIGTILSFVLSNTWEGVTNLSIFGTTIVNMPITNHILLNLPYYIMVLGFVGIVVMFAKPYLQGQI